MYQNSAMKRLEVIFSEQGDLLILDMRLGVKMTLKELFPNANPLRVILGFPKRGDLKIPEKTQFINHLLPMLTGLEKEDLKKIEEIALLKSHPKEEVLNIKSIDV